MKQIFIVTAICIYFFTAGCSGCSRSGRRQIHHVDTTQKNHQEVIQPAAKKTVVKMKKVNGVYEIPTEINDIPMHFIFDTGAGIISISETEATFLYKQGKLTQDDVLGNSNFSDANGDVSEGTIINLKTVKLGDRILENVQASVVHNLGAPLLMGQSALEKFGKISIDYGRGEITFE